MNKRQAVVFNIKVEFIFFIFAVNVLMIFLFCSLTVYHKQQILCYKQFCMHLRDAIRRQFPSMFYDVIVLYTSKNVIVIFL